MSQSHLPVVELLRGGLQQVTTEGGHLVITMDEQFAHDLNFQSGMIQSWNKFCFTTGYVEVAVSLPLSTRQPGTWPGRL